MNEIAHEKQGQFKCLQGQGGQPANICPVPIRGLPCISRGHITYRVSELKALSKQVFVWPVLMAHSVTEGTGREGAAGKSDGERTAADTETGGNQASMVRKQMSEGQG